MIPKTVRGLGLAAAACVLMMPAVAGAIGVSIVDVSSTGSSTTSLARGDVLTFDLVVSNPDRIEVFGIGLLAFGYDADRNLLADEGLEFFSVARSASLFSSDASGSGSWGGLTNVMTRNEDSIRPYWSSPTEFTGRVRGAMLFAGVSLSPSTGDGSLDIGVDGRRIAEGDVHFRIAFRATPRSAETSLRLGFGIGSPTGTGSFSHYAEGVVGRGGVLQPFTDAYHQVTILANPEPGTALLIGLGLGGLAALRPRRVADGIVDQPADPVARKVQP